MRELHLGGNQLCDAAGGGGGGGPHDVQHDTAALTALAEAVTQRCLAAGESPLTAAVQPHSNPSPLAVISAPLGPASARPSKIVPVRPKKVRKNTLRIYQDI